MPNKIPEKVKQQIHERADKRCEHCGTSNLNNCGQVPAGIHHIIPRRKRVHRTETLILLCSQCHTRAEQGYFGKQLRLRLQQHYRLKGYSEKRVRELMGGKSYLREG